MPKKYLIKLEVFQKLGLGPALVAEAVTAAHNLSSRFSVFSAWIAVRFLALVFISPVKIKSKKTGHAK